MDTRTKRFVAAAVESVPAGANLASEGLAGAGWVLRALAAHPIGGEPLAVAFGQAVSEPSSGRGSAPVFAGIALTLTAVRTEGTVEVSAGIVFHHHLTQDGRLADGGSPVFIPSNVAPAYRGTAVIRCAWHVAGDAPDVAAFRGRPVPGRQEEHVIHLAHQMTARWRAGESDPEQHESVLSGRVEAFGESDRLAVGIPWLHADRELALSFGLAGLHTAVAEVTALVSP